MTVEPRKRGRPPATSCEEIATAALRLAVQEGVEAVTIRRLAAEIGVAPMTIYSHAQTKDEIIDLMTAAALESFEFRLDPEQPWPAQLHAGFLALYETMRAHPVVVDLITGSRAMTGPAVDRVRETLLGAMDAAGLPRQRAVDIFNTLGAYVVGVVTIETARERRAAELVAHVRSLPRGKYPVLSKAPATWARPIPSETIELGLRCLIDGLCRDLVD
jgi:AcrR family transcriptional regulator